MSNGAAAVGNSLADPQNVKHRAIKHDPAIPSLGIYPRDENTHSHQHLYTDVHSSDLYDNKNVETIQIYING